MHPAIHGGILSKNRPEDQTELAEFNIRNIDILICNLYPFEKIASGCGSHDDIIENIDIGGVTLMRAAAKNYRRVTAICDVADYQKFIDALRNSDNHEVPLKMRRSFALKVFNLTSKYDETISSYLRSNMAEADTPPQFLKLRYGVNPHQSSAFVFMKGGSDLPFEVLCGAPGYINIMDALNSWPLVRELSEATGLPAAASFKHVSPSGAAVGVPLSPEERIAFAAQKPEVLSPLACAYARARGADRMSSFGDWIALSHCCDGDTATLISSEVSDGVIAPGYSEAALEVLRKKKGGKYCVLQINPDYTPADSHVESRDLYGITLVQQRNCIKINSGNIGEVVTSSPKSVSDIPKEVIRDIIVALTALKYTQSNSVCYASNGMVIGLGAGQQSRIHCTRLAGDKADNLWLRMHPKTLALKFKPLVKKPARSNAIDSYVTGNFGDMAEFYSLFTDKPELLTPQIKADWMSKRSGTVMCSDAFFPFSDNIIRAKKSGVSYIVAPKGSVMDAEVTREAEKQGIALIYLDYRLFHH